MNYKILRITIEDHVALITISRPQAMNALNSDFFTEMNGFLNGLTEDIRAIIITGEGKAFVAGADISEMVNKTKEEAYLFSRNGQATFDRLEKLDLPVIAAVNGFALGGGCELAMACDFRIASTTAKFGQPEVNLGLIPGYAATQRLSRLVGLGNALYLLFTADTISAEEALKIGLVQKVVDNEMLLTEAMDIAKRILSKGPEAIKAVKRVTRAGINTNFEEACRLESIEFSKLFESEAREGMKAFLEKRKPEW